MPDQAVTIDVQTYETLGHFVGKENQRITFTERELYAAMSEKFISKRQAQFEWLLDKGSIKPWKNLSSGQEQLYYYSGPVEIRGEKYATGKGCTREGYEYQRRKVANDSMRGGYYQPPVPYTETRIPLSQVSASPIVSAPMMLPSSSQRGSYAPTQQYGSPAPSVSAPMMLPSSSQRGSYAPTQQYGSPAPSVSA
ncbi:hypothetical protein, partial [Streptomyces tauricus]|uniref:hypothetical protein n=1 Tax=Streptomyces tauricus TaxID=68274 RepID=UPI002243A2C6